ncbi:MAG: H(+)-transporting ATPase [Tenericutes bacterium]|jgi:trk system potassium uptake protein TrkH|nr:H(+)-transporting ATPase [Mycoplasmatota bacterium]
MKKKKLSPLIVILISFLSIIVVGTFLFKLPFTTVAEGSLSWVDSIFLAASAVCVTGLSTISSIGDSFTIYGKVVLALLIQIGGLGIVTIAIYVLMILGIKIGVTERYLVKEALNQPTHGGMIKLVRSIVLVTLTIEFIGMLINFTVFIQDFDFWKALGVSAFHAISSFNNAGFDIFGASSMQAYSSNILLNINTMALIIIGGIGFIVIRDLLEKKNWKNLTIYSKIVLKITLFLIVFGALLIKLLEYDQVTWLEAVFQSVTTRTAGFSTVNISQFSYITLIVIIAFMFVGASPNSTGGGIKTTSLYIIYGSIISFLRGKPFITNKRMIENSNRIKALVIAILAFTITIVFFLIISVIEAKNGAYDNKMLNILFETFSAFGTVGLSTGITTELFPATKILLSILMFIGRLGPITVFGIINQNWKQDMTGKIDYPKQHILVG